jgi:hypothetical protein
MRVIVGFIIGVVFAAFVLWFMVGTPASAQTEGESSLADLLPDIGRIYRTSLAAPFQQVEKEIYDPDIANYYHRLMRETGLNQIDAEP